MGPEFWQTPMGRRYYEHTLPELTKQLERLAKALEALLPILAGAESPEAKR